MKAAIKSVSDAVLQQPDLLDREETILKDIQTRVDFVVEKRVGDSRYWTRDFAGAVFYRGKYQGKDTVLKIQGTKPPISEIDQIKGFSDQNKSLNLRPPKVYGFLRWEEEKRYEALFLEDVNGETIIHFPTTELEVTDFFTIFREYRQNCRKLPWLEPPPLTLAQLIETDFKNWKKISWKLYPQHPFRERDDKTLVEMAVGKLTSEYREVTAEFLHGHFSYYDLKRIQTGEVILFSNLFWKYKAPFYDAVFGYHWFVYRLARVEGMTPELIDVQRQLWLKQIDALAKNEGDKKLINLALLERAAAGLNLDVLSVETKLPMAKYLAETTRTEVKRLMGAC